MISAVNARPLYNSSTTGASSSGGATGAPASANAPGGAMGKDQFMKLLIAQMQNQDPMNPMQGDQMAAQLAQFSTLEQMQQMNTTLAAQSGAQAALLGAIQTNAAMGTIGHNVLAIGDEVQVGGTGATTQVTADIAANAVKATLNIYDANGKVVGSRDLGAISGGRQTFALGDALDGVRDGNYTYAIDARDGNGNAIGVTTYTSGRVDGISSGTDGLVLNLGTLEIPYARVISVTN